MLRHLLRLSVCAVSAVAPLRAQTASAPPKRIEDNSFLLEEAYNQEFGVVQHISTFQRSRTGSWMYTLTQEWPVPSQRHQLSYTVPVSRADGSKTGLGDIALNYRYQLLGADEALTWFAPRISVYVPTGDVAKGTGAGGPGIEVNVPLSRRFGESFVTHWNVGTLVTRADNGAGQRGTTTSFRGGISAIWLVTPTFNLMLESVASRAQQLDALGARYTETSYLLSPGFRAAINTASGLQIVPGLAVPLGVGPNSDQRDVFVYLSFEHAFRK